MGVTRIVIILFWAFFTSSATTIIVNSNVAGPVSTVVKIDLQVAWYYSVFHQGILRVGIPT